MSCPDNTHGDVVVHCPPAPSWMQVSTSTRRCCIHAGIDASADAAMPVRYAIGIDAAHGNAIWPCCRIAALHCHIAWQYRMAAISHGCIHAGIDAAMRYCRALPARRAPRPPALGCVVLRLYNCIILYNIILKCFITRPGGRRRGWWRWRRRGARPRRRPRGPPPPASPPPSTAVAAPVL